MSRFRFLVFLLIAAVPFLHSRCSDALQFSSVAPSPPPPRRPAAGVRHQQLLPRNVVGWRGGGTAPRAPMLANRFGIAASAASATLLRSSAAGSSGGGGGEVRGGANREDATAVVTTVPTAAKGAAAAATTPTAAAAAAAATSSALPASPERPPRIGDVVSVLCRLVPEGSFVPEPLFDGVVLEHECHKGKDDGSPADLVPITMVLGKGNYLPGLHEVILTRLSKVGDRVTDVSLDAGYGARNPSLVADIAFDSLSGGGIDPSQIDVGTQLQLSNGVVCTVTHVTPNESFTIDGNHPLAGASYRADVELDRIEEGPTVTPYVDGPAETTSSAASRYHFATFALGCFWGGELEYMRERGVVGTRVGYTQGNAENPTYEQVCGGTTGHTEAIVVTYDPDIVSYERLVHLAMDRLGDSKYLKNQVGNDRGTQYRHGVYYHYRDQKDAAERIVASYGEDCRTECLPAQFFYEAEEYHQQYLLKGGQSARKGDPSVIRCYG
jgi:peptide-methionine (S)-S-oxide reductase